MLLPISWHFLQVLACVLLLPLGPSEDGTQCGELAAFCVHPSYRGAGRGDSLLDYVEQQARDKGIRRLVSPSIVCGKLRDSLLSAGLPSSGAG